jgi:hypothetical protein
VAFSGFEPHALSEITATAKITEDVEDFICGSPVSVVKLN